MSHLDPGDATPKQKMGVRTAVMASLESVGGTSWMEVVVPKNRHLLTVHWRGRASTRHPFACPTRASLEAIRQALRTDTAWVVLELDCFRPGRSTVLVFKRGGRDNGAVGSKQRNRRR